MLSLKYSTVVVLNSLSRKRPKIRLKYEVVVSMVIRRRKIPLRTPSFSSRIADGCVLFATKGQDVSHWPDMFLVRNQTTLTFLGDLTEVIRHPWWLALLVYSNKHHVTTWLDIQALKKDKSEEANVVSGSYPKSLFFNACWNCGPKFDPRRASCIFHERNFLSWLNFCFGAKSTSLRILFLKLFFIVRVLTFQKDLALIYRKDDLKCPSVLAWTDREWRTRKKNILLQMSIYIRPDLHKIPHQG